VGNMEGVLDRENGLFEVFLFDSSSLNNGVLF